MSADVCRGRGGGRAGVPVGPLRADFPSACVADAAADLERPGGSGSRVTEYDDGRRPGRACARGQQAPQLRLIVRRREDDTDSDIQRRERLLHLLDAVGLEGAKRQQFRLQRPRDGHDNRPRQRTPGQDDELIRQGGREPAALRLRPAQADNRAAGVGELEEQPVGAGLADQHRGGRGIGRVLRRGGPPEGLRTIPEGACAGLATADRHDAVVEYQLQPFDAVARCHGRRRRGLRSGARQAPARQAWT